MGSRKKTLDLPTMKLHHQKVLRDLRRKIVDDLDVRNGIISPLVTEYILRDEDVNRINAIEDREEQAKVLLDLLPSRGPSAFDVFHQALRKHYWWLSNDIDDKLKSLSTIAMDTAVPNINLQPVSPLTVTRAEKIKKLKAALSEVTPGGYVVLHGMKGYGKSCLTASTLKDKDFTSSQFNNEIYWLKFGNQKKQSDQILIQLNNLYHQIRNSNTLPELLNSEPLAECLKQSINVHFKKSGHENALLILDDVYDRDIISAFEFNCKILVITVDIGVLGTRNRKVVEMEHGFTERETLGLFSKVIEVGVEELPIEAKRIHEECKGMPLLIAMIAAQMEEFKHDLKTKADRWNYYLSSIRNKNMKNDIMKEFYKKQETTFNMIIEKLDDEMKSKYYMLAIFNEDINIMPKTLEILWEGEPFYVEDQMLKFCHKSLAAKQWNDELRSYVYGVHDLLLSHIRHKFTSEQLKHMHGGFVEKCRKYCNGDFSKLPDDNYSFSYIGHHMEKAEMYNEFPKLYLNFDFLQAKINATGLNDLLIDLKKYRKHIVRGDIQREADVTDLEDFLELNASTLTKHGQKKCLDLIQIALNYPKEGFVSCTARDLATKRSFLHLTHERDASHLYLTFCEDVRMDADVICATNDMNAILIGNQGEIILWDCKKRTANSFYRYNKNCIIKKIKLSFNGNYFLALSDDGSMKLFYLTESECTSDKEDVPLCSPKLRQSAWRGFFADDIIDDSLRTFTIDNEMISDMVFSKNSDLVAACTTTGTIAVWDFDGECHWLDTKNNIEIGGGITFTTNDNLLHVMDTTRGVLVIYKRSSNSYVYLASYNLQVPNQNVIYFAQNQDDDNCLVIVTDREVLHLKWFGIGEGNEYVHTFEKNNKIKVEDDSTRFVAATITYDARYLIIANSKGIVQVLKARNPDHWITSFKGIVTSLDSYWIVEEECHVIYASEKRWIYRWRVGTDEKPKSLKTVLFDAKMKPLGFEDTIVQKTSPTTIVHWSGKNTTKAKYESINGKIVMLRLHDSGKKVLYVTERGFIILLDLDTNETIKIIQLNTPDEFVAIINIDNTDFIVSQEPNKQNLTVWENIKISHQVKDTGYVLSVLKKTEQRIMMVAQDVVSLWEINNSDKSTWSEWVLIRKVNDKVGDIISSSFSDQKSLLAVLKESWQVNIFKITDVDIEIYTTCEYGSHLTCCSFSPDEKYLAIGMDNGTISVIDVAEKVEVGTLILHSGVVNELHWSPINISTSILLSVNCDELAWWNVSLLLNQKAQKRRSRMGFVRSNSVSNNGAISRIAHSISADLQQLRLSNENNESCEVNNYWAQREVKDSKRPAFLGVVHLPANCTGKVKIYVSSDFAKFLTIDIHGGVSSYTLFGLN